MHEVELLHGCGLRPGQADGAGVVDHDVDSPEMLDGVLDGLLDRLLGADVHHAGQGVPAGRLN